MRFKNLTPEQIETFKIMYSKRQLKELAELFDIDRANVYRWHNKLNKGSTPQPLKSSTEEITGLTGKSTLYDSEGNVKLEWVKTKVDKVDELQYIKDFINELVEDIPARHEIDLIEKPSYDDLVTVYVGNDIHFGALMWGKETLDRDYDLKIAEKTVKSAYNYLIESSPKTKYGMVLDLGDLLEIDDFKNQTPKSGNILTVDGRYPKVLRAAYMSLIYGIERALQKHEVVYFVNISGNHDITSGHCIREVISAWFRNNPRVVIDNSPSAIKYFHFGETLIQFAHGDGMSMKDSGEVMVVDKREIISSVKHCYSLFGHTHKDVVVDTRLTRAESFRNLAPLNDWASHKGYRGGIGTMTSITYSNTQGEISRNKFNVNMVS